MVVYDQWEDGYEADIANPLQSSTKVWIYQNNTWYNDTNQNGVYDSGTDTAVSSTTTNGVKASGASIILSNAVNPTSPLTVDFDGRDKIGSTKAVSVSRAGWSDTPGTVLAGAVNLIDVANSGLVYTLPVGQNVETVATGTNKLFEYTSAHIIATPLITNSDGKKFGKSEGNAVWLDAEFTSPYAFYQFWLNVEDADVVDRLKVFTFLSRAEIEELAKQTAEAPYLRAAQKRLALEVTTLVHGANATESAIAASAALFGNGDLESLDTETLKAALSELPNVTVSDDHSLAQALVDTGLVDSLSAGRRAIKEGGVYLNNLKVDDEAATVGSWIPGGFAVLRRGKKTLSGLFRA